LLPEGIKANVKVEICKRISDWKNGMPIWSNEWVDVSEYYMSTVTDYEFSIDDNNLAGKYSQESINIKFTNQEGTFNPQGTDFSLWNDGEYIYHSRLRLYEWLGERTADPADLVIDGLIAVTTPSYYKNGDCNILVNSKLDMLREHFLVTETNSRAVTASSQGIMNYIIKLFDTYYSELNVTYKGCVFYNSVNHENLAAYQSSLIDLFFEIIDNGGGYGGMVNNILFSSFVGAPDIQGENFKQALGTISRWHFKEGTGTTIADENSVNTLTTNGTWKEGLFDSSVSNFVLYNNAGIFPEIVDQYTIDILFDISVNKLFPTKVPYVFNSSSIETGIYPLAAWSSDGVSTDVIACNMNASYDVEGFFLTNTYEIAYGRGVVSGGGFAFANYVILGALDANEMTQYVSLAHNGSNIDFYKNGRYVNGAYDTNSGSVAFTPAKRKRLVGYGHVFWKHGSSASTEFKLTDTCAIYYNGLRIGNRALIDSDIFDTYLETFSRRLV
jgi:hypothetical protein